MAKYTYNGMIKRIMQDLTLANNKVSVQDGDFANDIAAQTIVATKIANRIVQNMTSHYHIVGFTQTISRIDWHYLGNDSYQREETAVK